MVSERIVDEHRARRFHALRNVTGGGNHDRRDSSRFDNPRDQTDGLVVERSSRNQDHSINAVFKESLRECRRRVCKNSRTSVNPTHEAAV